MEKGNVTWKEDGVQQKFFVREREREREKERETERKRIK